MLTFKLMQVCLCQGASMEVCKFYTATLGKASITKMHGAGVTAPCVSALIPLRCPGRWSLLDFNPHTLQQPPSQSWLPVIRIGRPPTLGFNNPLINYSRSQPIREEKGHSPSIWRVLEPHRVWVVSQRQITGHRSSFPPICK